MLNLKTSKKVNKVLNTETKESNDQEINKHIENLEKYIEDIKNSLGLCL